MVLETAIHQQIVEPSGKNELSDKQTWQVAFRLSEKLVIRNLGLHLGIESFRLDAIFQNNKKDITAHALLQEWRKRQTNDAEAYQNLLAVLKHKDVNLLQILHDVFGETVNLDLESGTK